MESSGTVVGPGFPIRHEAAGEGLPSHRHSPVWGREPSSSRRRRHERPGDPASGRQGRVDTRPSRRLPDAGGASLRGQDEIAECLWAEGLASPRAAARLWTLPWFNSFDRREITVTHSHQPPRCGILVHFTGRFFPHHATTVRGIPVDDRENAGRSWSSRARPRVAIAVDDALRRGLTNLRRLKRYLAESGGRGRRGAGVMRPILAERYGLDRAPESPLETKFLALLQHSPLPLPELQYEIWDGPCFVARVDFAYPERKLAIGVDGFQFHSGREPRPRRMNPAGGHSLHL